MAGTITGASAVIMLSVPGLFTTPQQLQGFAADDVFDTSAISSAETLMGVDGKLSGGFVFVAVEQNYRLQADSDSIAFFDQWWAQQQTINEVLPGNGTVSINATGKKFAMTRGFLTSYMPTPQVKKLLQPQTFRITWNRIVPQPS